MLFLLESLENVEERLENYDLRDLFSPIVIHLSNIEGKLTAMSDDLQQIKTRMADEEADDQRQKRRERQAAQRIEKSKEAA